MAVEPLAPATKSPLLQVRIYGEKLGDYQLVNSWWNARHGESMHEGLFPPLGVIVESDGEAVAALWCYEAYGIGVCHLENPVTRPGLSFGEARRAMGFAIEACVLTAKAHGDFTFFKAWPQTDSMIRCLRMFGFEICTPDGRGLYLIRE